MATRYPRATALAAIAALVAGCGGGVPPTRATASAAQRHRWHAPSDWPPLPTTRYIRGRVATATDVSVGNAVFSACVGVVGRALHVTIPQYALWRDPATDSIKPVFIVEAELFEGDSMFGLRQIPSGKDAMATSADLELLGQTPPGVRPAGSAARQ